MCFGLVWEEMKPLNLWHFAGGSLWEGEVEACQSSKYIEQAPSELI